MLRLSLFAFVLLFSSFSFSSGSPSWILSDAQNELRQIVPPEGCTTIALTPEASTENAASVTHTNDCKDCDFRMSLVPGRTWPAHSLRGIAPSRFSYPRYIGDDRGEPLKASTVDYSIFPWKATVPVGHIPQVSRTYSWIDGVYGIMNEKQVAIGESTTAARIVAKPSYADGFALFDVSELTRVAIERASTAREAIQIIGDLATRYGYYGAEWEGEYAFGEAGEALTIADPKEAWVFHILPDDTGKSAVWAAQRVPSGHIAIVANAFIIKEIDFSDAENFIFSSNIKEVALRNNFWNPEVTKGFHFSEIFGAKLSFEMYCTHRQWRLFTWANPSLQNRIEFTMTTAELPFSVKPDRLLSPRDLMTIQRDHYEGTPLDMTQGLAAGPYGNPNRYDRGSVEGVAMAVLMQGTFERAISLFRTSYSFVTVSRASVADSQGMMWLSHAAPHASIYLPLFPFSSSLPISHSSGSLYQVSRSSSFWATTLIQNWMERAFKYIKIDVKKAQDDIESELFGMHKDLEKELSSFPSTDMRIRERISEFQNKIATQKVEQWWQFFDHLVAKYHDGYRLDNFHSETIDPTPLFYPVPWLQAVGFFPKDVKVDYNRTSWSYTLESPTVIPFHQQQQKQQKSKSLIETQEIQNQVKLEHSSGSVMVVNVLLLCVVSVCVGFFIGRCTKTRQEQEYIELN